MAICRQQSTVPTTIPSDPQIPIPPPQGDDAAPASPDASSFWSGVVIAPSGVSDLAPPVSDPWNPVPDAQSDPGQFQTTIVGRDAPPVAITNNPTPSAMLQTPDYPVKVDPVTSFAPPTDYALPVPTATSDPSQFTAGPATGLGTIAPPDANIAQPTDYNFPVPTAETDPDVVLVASDAPDLPVVPADNVMDNWTAETTADTECPPETEIDPSGSMMEA